jgi:chromosome condensin MukBEF ATPase and DNA-binding subunit MukB
MPTFPERGNLKAVQAIKLFRLSLDKHSSPRDRSWAMSQFIEAKKHFSHKDLVEAINKQVTHSRRLRASLKRQLREMRGDS